MNVLHVMPDFPFPADNGARADVWSRIVAMKALGYSIDALVIAPRVRPSQSQIAEVRRHVNTLHFVDPRPLYKCIATTIPTCISRNAALSDHRLNRGYDITLMEAEHTFAITQNPTLDTRRTVVRVHNDEAAWLRDSLKLEESMTRRQFLRLELLRLKPFIRNVHERADQLWFISQSEWQRFVTGNRSLEPKAAWLPPSLEIRKTATRIDPKNNRVLFVGNFYTSLNRDALRWYLECIHPLLQSIPNYEFVVAGSTHGRDAARSFAEQLSCNRSCTVHVDMPDPTSLYDNCAVFVNPMRAGAGVKLKSIHAIEHRIPVVSTAIGNEGTGFDGGQHLKIADTAEHFVTAVKELLYDQALRELQSERAYNRLLERYDPARNISQLVDGVSAFVA